MCKQNSRRLSVWLFSCLFSLSLCSCTAAPRAVQPYPVWHEPAAATARQPLPPVHGIVAPAAHAVDMLHSSLALVSDRVTAYEDKLAAWQKFSAGTADMNLDAEQQGKLAACQQQLQGILTGYNGLQQKLLQSSQAQAEELPVRALFF